MVAIPFILGRYGNSLREWRPWARVHVESEDNLIKAEREDVTKDDS